MTRRARLALILGCLVALQAGAVALYLIVERSRQPAPPPFAAELLSAKEQAPELRVRRADGAELALTWPAPRPRLLHFWATWCPPCVKELPSLLAFARDQRGLELVAIAVEDDWAAIGEFFQGAIPPEIVVEQGDVAHRQLGVATLPDSYLIDAGGKVIERYHGARDWSSAQARGHVLDKIARKAPVSSSPPSMSEK